MLSHHLSIFIKKQLMKIIAPYQISSEIINIIHQAKKYLILVSPYIDILKWDAFKTELLKAQKREVKISVYIRYENDNYKSWEQLEAFGIKPKLIEGLHAKLYFNENTGIVTSMNLLNSSNLGALEFGALYDTPEELYELKSFVKSYLSPIVEKQIPTDEDIYLSKEKFTTILINALENELKRGISCRWDGRSFLLNAGNQFNFNIDKVKNSFYIDGIISELEHDNYSYFLQNTDLQKKAVLTLQNNSIIVTLNKKLSSSNFDHLLTNEKTEVLDCILDFVSDLLFFKEYCYKNKKLLSNNL